MENLFVRSLSLGKTGCDWWNETLAALPHVKFGEGDGNRV